MNPEPLLADLGRPVKLAACVLAGALALGSAAKAQSRGELLYSTHCIACHSAQMHWRDKKLATDWDSLRAQVRHWQGVALLGWSEDDILEVTRHLNQRFYGFTPTSNSLSQWSPAAAEGRVGLGSK